MLSAKGQFWKMAYDRNMIHPDKEFAKIKLRLMVITETNPHGEITPDEYKIITDEDFYTGE